MSAAAGLSAAAVCMSADASIARLSLAARLQRIRQASTLVHAHACTMPRAA